MRISTLTIVLIAFFLSSAEMCNSRENLSPDDKAVLGCFSDAPLEKITWAKKQLETFQRPKSGPLNVAVYSYRREQFLVFSNVFVSCPACYIFNCSGNTIAQRNIQYNAFFDEAKEVKVLLEGNY